MIDSTNGAVDVDYAAACRRIAEGLIGKIHTLRRCYWEASGLHIDQMVVLAGTNVVGALHSNGGRDPFFPPWNFDRKTGVLQAAALARCRVIVCEDPDLHDLEYRIMVPSQDDMLGRPTVERGTLTGAPA